MTDNIGIEFAVNNVIFPEIFDSSVTAFFTRKPLGVNVEEICHFFSFEKDNVYLPIQKHTDNVQVVSSDLNTKIADSVLTERKGILIGVQVADCVPILFYDAKRLLVGAVHAGWRGTASRIIKKTIGCMIQEFGSSPADIRMAIGPSIKWRCYQVGVEVKEAVCEATGGGDYYLKRDGQWYIDLASANHFQAISMGVSEENTWISPECTHCNPKDYHSYRYEKTYNGAQGGFIGII
jgi:YfiH family protein